MIDEGYVKYRARWSETPPLEHAALDPLCQWRNRLHDAGLIGHYDALGIGFGNLSARIDGDRFLISGTQTGHIDESTASLFALVTAVNIDENSVECCGPVQASSEAMTHAAIYRADASINAVVHVHSDPLWRSALGQLPATAKEIAYGTPAMADELARLVVDPSFQSTGIAAMAGHDEGLIAVGGNVGEAARRILAFQETCDAESPSG